MAWPGRRSGNRVYGCVAVFGSTVVQLQGAGDQGEVAECLRGVTQLPLRDGVPFLAQEPDVVAKAQEPFEQDDGLVASPGAVQGVHQPE